MLNKPKFVSPSINMYGNTVIDLNSDTLPFSCILDGNEAVTDWQIEIRKLNDDIVVFQTNKITLNTPFFPINNRNQNVTFSIDLRDYFESATVCSDDFVNSANAYYWTITFWNSSSGSVVKSTPEVFYANSIPETAIYYNYENSFLKEDNSLDETLLLSTNELKKSILKQRKIFFKSSYIQTENINLKRYGWRLTDITNNVVILDTISQNQIYGVADGISCVCNGLVNKTSYMIELYIETQNGYFGVLQSVKFDVDYPVKNIDADFEIEALNSTSGVVINWGNLKTTEGVVYGKEISYVENFPVSKSVSAQVQDGSEIIFSDTSNDKALNIEEDSYVVLSLQFDKTKDVTLFEMSGFDNFSNSISRRLIYTASDGVLKYIVTKGDISASFNQSLSPYVGELCWYVITLYPMINNAVEFKLVEDVAKNTLFPDDEDLYPTSIDDEEAVYPCFGEWNKIREKK